MTPQFVRHNPIFGGPLPCDAGLRRIKLMVMAQVTGASYSPEDEDAVVEREPHSVIRRHPFFGERYPLESMLPEDTEMRGYLTSVEEFRLINRSGGAGLILMRLQRHAASLGRVMLFRFSTVKRTYDHLFCRKILVEGLFIAESWKFIKDVRYVVASIFDKQFESNKLAIASAIEVAKGLVSRSMFGQILVQLLCLLLTLLTSCGDTARILPERRPGPHILAAGGQTALHIPLN